MGEMDKVIIGAQLTLLNKEVSIGKPDDMESNWAALEKCVEEMMDTSLYIGEREFAMQRALYLLGELRNYYIGGKE